jgi:hypothetical protein
VRLTVGALAGVRVAHDICRQPYEAEYGFQLSLFPPVDHGVLKLCPSVWA